MTNKYFTSGCVYCMDLPFPKHEFCMDGKTIIKTGETVVCGCPKCHPVEE